MLGPPSLRVAFDSAEAAARLQWEAPPVDGFRRYRVERAADREFQVLAELESATDTTYTDTDLQGNRAYRYRVVCLFGTEGHQVQSLASTVVEGGIHRFVNAWQLPPGFAPTRLVVDDGGGLAVVGAGSGWVERFDRGGNPVGRWRFATEPLACLETGTLDGPAAALDREGSLYVVYNLLDGSGAPRALWTKFDRGGAVLWTRPLAAVFARHIAIDGDRIYVESISQLQQFSPDGELVSEYRVPALLVSSLRFWRGAFAALVEPLNVSQLGWQAPRLVRYTGAERGEVSMALGRDPLTSEDQGPGLLHRPSDFAVAEVPDRVFVVNAGYSRIEVFREGVYLTRWGEEGEGEGAFRFAGTARVIDDMATGTTRERPVVAGGIARDPQGYVYVADTFNHRVQKFQP
ncbi:MAG: hypothetical protein ABIL09_17140 [Gemmatimonadota bacterium]